MMLIDMVSSVILIDMIYTAYMIVDLLMRQPETSESH
jgi:hypothetical protein